MFSAINSCEKIGGVTSDMKNEKILVFRNDRLGEFLLIIPALRALKKTFKCWLTVIVNPYLQDLAHCIPEVDEVFTWEMKKHKLKDILVFSHLLRQKKFNTAIIMNPTKEAHLISFLAKIPVRVGYGRKWGFLLNRKIPDRKSLGLKHEVEYNLELVSLIGAKTEDKSLRLEIPENIKEDIVKLLKKYELDNKNFVVIHPFTSDSYKQWPLNNFYKLMNMVEGKRKIVIIGGKEELRRVEVFKSLIDDFNVVSFVGRLNLIQLAELLKKAQILISNDSGPVHLACCVNTPCIILFNRSNPSKSSKRWGPWGKGHVVIEKDSLEDISVEEVLEKIREKLEL